MQVAWGGGGRLLLVWVWFLYLERCNCPVGLHPHCSLWHCGGCFVLFLLCWARGVSVHFCFLHNVLALCGAFESFHTSATLWVWQAGLCGTAGGLRLAQVSGLFHGQISLTAVLSSATAYLFSSVFPPIELSVLPIFLLLHLPLLLLLLLSFSALALHPLIAPLAVLASTLHCKN